MSKDLEAGTSSVRGRFARKQKRHRARGVGALHHDVRLKIVSHRRRNLLSCEGFFLGPVR